jgi:hypothetical protein
MAKLRTIFIHPSLPERTVKNPAGWKALELSLERDQIFHTLVEYFKGNFMWYGNALTTIKEIEATDGIKAQIGVRFEVSFKMDVWVTLYTGMLKIAQKEEIYTGIILNKITCPVIRDDFWSKFFNRYKTPVNLESTTDMDGGTRTAVAKTTVAMRGQLVRVKAKGFRDFTLLSDPLFWSGRNIDIYFQSNHNRDIINDDAGEFQSFEKVNNIYPFDVNEFDLKVKYQSASCQTRYKYRARLKLDPIGSWGVGDQLLTFNHVIQIQRQNGAFEEDSTNLLAGISLTALGTSTYTSAYINVDHSKTFSDVLSGDRIFSYFTCFTDASGPATVDHYLEYDSGDQDQFAEIVYDSSFPDSVTDAYLIKQACEATISKYVGADSVVISTKFSDTTFNRNAIFRGKHNRGYTFSQKEMSTSFDEIYQGIDPMFNLCLGYTKVSGVNKIFIEDKSYAYNPTVVVNIPNCRNIVRKNDLERYFKTIEIGYSKSLSESESGIDDPQTKQTRNADLPTFGKDEKIVSRFIAASLAIERSRRNRVEQGKDDRLDEDMMIVSVIPGSPWTLEFNENFTSILGLLNSTKRANVRHTVMRLFKRWQNFINPSLSVGEEFTFGRGEGNYNVTTTISGSDYESASGTVSEKDAFVAGSSRLWSNKIIEVTDVEMPFGTYEQIVANKENAIGVSRTESNFVPCFILDFNYKLFDGKASFVVLQANEDEI